MHNLLDLNTFSIRFSFGVARYHQAAFDSAQNISSEIVARVTLSVLPPLESDISLVLFFRPLEIELQDRCCDERFSRAVCMRVLVGPSGVRSPDDPRLDRIVADTAGAHAIGWRRFHSSRHWHTTSSEPVRHFVPLTGWF